MEEAIVAVGGFEFEEQCVGAQAALHLRSAFHEPPAGYIEALNAGKEDLAAKVAKRIAELGD